MPFCSLTYRLRQRHSNEELRRSSIPSCWVETMWVSGRTLRVYKGSICHVLSKLDLMTAARLCFVKPDNHLFVISPFPLIHFDTHALNCNPGIDRLLFQKKAKHLCLWILYNCPLPCPRPPHTKGFIIFKKLPSLSLFPVMFLWKTAPAPSCTFYISPLMQWIKSNCRP